jgi:hypothetical protein
MRCLINKYPCNSYILLPNNSVGQNSVGLAVTATRYELDGPEIESWRGCGIVRTRPDLPWGPPNLLYRVYRVSFPGVKRPGLGFDHPLLSSAEVKERVVYIFFTLLGLRSLLREFTVHFR